MYNWFALFPNAEAFFYGNAFFAEELVEAATEKRDGGDGAQCDNRDGDVGNSRLVNLRLEKESQHQDNPPVNGENHKCVAGDVSQNAFGDADWRDVGKFAC